MADINSLLYLWRAWTCSPGQTPVSPAWTGRCGDQDKWHIPQVFGSPGGSSPWLCLEKVLGSTIITAFSSSSNFFFFYLFLRFKMFSKTDQTPKNKTRAVSQIPPPFATLNLIPKSPPGPPELWLAVRMIPPMALIFLMMQDTAGVDRRPLWPITSRPIWTAHICMRIDVCEVSKQDCSFW